MGPRARARGNHPAAATDVKNSGLQWGHERALVEITGAHALPVASRRFNGATSARSWKSGESSPAVTPHSGFNGATSARSWKSGGDGGVGEGGGASMGPRARARGNTDTGYGPFVTIGLQWGHERALVEMTPAPGLQVVTLVLQWGHERALVEILRSTPFRRQTQGLQWGHERALVEISSSSKYPSGMACFNGATSARSWKLVAVP